MILPDEGKKIAPEMRRNKAFQFTTLAQESFLIAPCPGPLQTVNTVLLLLSPPLNPILFHTKKSSMGEAKGIPKYLLKALH